MCCYYSTFRIIKMFLCQIFAGDIKQQGGNLRPCLQGGRVTLMLGLLQQEGYPSTRTFLLVLHDVYTRQVGLPQCYGNPTLSARVTLPRGLPRHSHISSFFTQRVCKASRVPSARVTLLSARVTLARELPYLPCKHCVRGNLSTRNNVPLPCLTSNLDNLNRIIQFLSLIINI